MERREDRARAKEAPVRERTGEEKPAPEKKVSAQKKKRALRGVGYVAVVAVFSALLLGAQYALWFVKGVEVVTVLLLVFSYRFGVRCGVLSAVAFSLLRCLLFGFFPNVVLLYLIYYPLFAACFGLLGNALRRRVDLKTQLLVTALAVPSDDGDAVRVRSSDGILALPSAHGSPAARQAVNVVKCQVFPAKCQVFPAKCRAFLAECQVFLTCNIKNVTEVYH